MMHHLRKLLFALLLLTNLPDGSAQQPLKLWYNTPASAWTDALPVGNGRLGAMVFGRAGEELISLNESSLWSGGPANLNPNPDAASFLPKIRQALFAENYIEAETMCRQMQGLYTEAYMPLGDLVIKQVLNGAPTNYYRDLNISDATASTRFTVNDVTYSREVLASAPDQVVLVRLRSSQKGALSFDATVQSQLQFGVATTPEGELVIRGKAPAHADPNYVKYNPEPVIYSAAGACRGMRFELRLKARNTDGTLTSDATGLHVRGATEVVLFLSAATSFNGFDKCPDQEGKDEDRLAKNYLASAVGQTYQQLRQRHVQDYQQYFNRVSLSLNQNPAPPLPILDRLKKYADGGQDPALEALYFQYGRYLLISSSRPGGLPANLQGIWNNSVRPPWSSNYTTNINAQMNYWLAEPTNLAELHEPFLDFITHAAATGRATAQNFYHARGWAVHHNSDYLGYLKPRGRLGKRRPHLGQLEYGQPLAESTFVRALPLHRQHGVFANHRLSLDERGG